MLKIYWLATPEENKKKVLPLFFIYLRFNLACFVWTRE
jgi:hypothetical protein